MKLEPFWTVAEVTGNAVEMAKCPRLGKIYAESGGQTRPARNVVQAPALHHGNLIEIDAVAMRRQGDAS
jgi:enamine deaminase RidA (YjgF/YER057c/UK114 family)